MFDIAGPDIRMATALAFAVCFAFAIMLMQRCDDVSADASELKSDEK